MATRLWWRHHRRYVRRYGLLSLWLLSLALIALGGFRPGYRSHLVEPSSDPVSTYPFAAVAIASAVTALECLVLRAILRPASFRHSWGRALAALSLFTPYAIVASMLLIHMPGYVTAHALWLFVVAGSLWILLVVSVVQAIRARRRSGGRTGAAPW